MAKGTFYFDKGELVEEGHLNIWDDHKPSRWGRALFRVKKDMARWGGAPIIGERRLPFIGGILVEEGHPLVGEGHTQMSFRRAKMPLLVGSYFIPPLALIA